MNSEKRGAKTEYGAVPARLFICALLLLMALLPQTAALAYVPGREFLFTLSCDGAVYMADDTVTATLTLERTDAGGAYSLFSAQDVVSYDGTRLELVSVDTSASGFSAKTDQAGLVRLYRYSALDSGIEITNPLTVAALTFRALDESGEAYIKNTEYEMGTPLGNVYMSLAVDAGLTVVGSLKAPSVASASAADGRLSIIYDGVTDPRWLSCAVMYDANGKMTALASCAADGRPAVSIPLPNAEYEKLSILTLENGETMIPVLPAYEVSVGGYTDD